MDDQKYICYNGPIGNGEKHNHLKVKLGVSGAAETGHCGLGALDIAKELDVKLSAKAGCWLLELLQGFRSGLL